MTSGFPLTTLRCPEVTELFLNRKRCFVCTVQCVDWADSLARLKISPQCTHLGWWLGICVEHLWKLAEQRTRDLGAHPQSQFFPRGLNMIQRAFGSLWSINRMVNPHFSSGVCPSMQKGRMGHDACQSFTCGLNKNIVHAAIYNNQKGNLILYNLLSQVLPDWTWSNEATFFQKGTSKGCV